MRRPDRLPIPDEVLRIAERLERAGYETWCVGGAVRDNLLGHDNKDFDLATAATPAEVRRLFRRTIPVGFEHGTVAVLDRRKQPHEVTTFRRDVTTDGRHAVVEFGVSLDDDLARRDFTINAIAYHPLRHEWRDLFDGMGDLGRGVIRAVGDPHRRFQEDYLRVLRALRFAARFGFRIHAATWDALRANVAGIERLSAERVRDEWFKGLETGRVVSEFVCLWCDIGAAAIWVREVRSALCAVDAPVVDRFRARDPVLITTYLSADPEATLRRLKCSNAEIERGRRIAAHRDAWPDAGSPVATRRWLSRVGAAADDLVAIALAEEAAATRERRGTALAKLVERVRRSGAPLTVADLAVNGDDLLALGIPKGPAVGDTLRRLLDAVLENPALNTKDELLRTARSGQRGRGEKGRKR